MEKIEFKANIKQITSKNLVSGDQEIRIILSVVGEDTLKDIGLAELKPDEQVKVETLWVDEVQTWFVDNSSIDKEKK